MENTIWVLLPPLLAIIMVLLTRRVLISLGVGIVSAAFFIANFNIIETVTLIWTSYKQVFISDGGLNTGNIYILLFVLILGILTALVSMMGGTRAFGDWMIRHVKTRAGAQIMTMILGMIIFVDDYFNSLTVGPVSRPITDKHRISRAKLAYIVDSTAAPISVISPVSSWGAYIIGLIGTVLVTQNVTGISAFEAFIKMIPMNFYVFAAFGVVLVIALTGVDFGPMRQHEKQAIKTGKVKQGVEKKDIQAVGDLPVSKLGKASDLLYPIGTLFVGTIVSMLIHGYIAVEGQASFIEILGAADVPLSLLIGGILSIVIASLLFIRHQRKGKISFTDYRKGIVTGVQSMVSATIILIFAWAISYLIELLKTGNYLAEIVAQSNLNLAFLPVIVFIMAGFIAFSTGTSWGAFAILLPIAGQIAGATDIELLLPVLAAVLAGAVFGDHCSPISDTTILSATGADCDLMDHVITQLPYALVAASITGVSYIVLGMFNKVLLSLAVLAVLLMFLFIILRLFGSRYQIDME